MVRITKIWWDRWKITILFVSVILLAGGLVAVNQTQNSQRVNAICGSLNQVRIAAFNLSRPAPETGVTDPALLARIKAANAARAQARRELQRDLAC